MLLTCHAFLLSYSSWKWSKIIHPFYFQNPFPPSSDFYLNSWSNWNWLDMLSSPVWYRRQGSLVLPRQYILRRDLKMYNILKITANTTRNYNLCNVKFKTNNEAYQCNLLCFQWELQENNLYCRLPPCKGHWGNEILNPFEIRQYFRLIYQILYTNHKQI